MTPRLALIGAMASRMQIPISTGVEDAEEWLGNYKWSLVSIYQGVPIEEQKISALECILRDEARLWYEDL